MRETKEPRREFAKYEELISDKPRFMERIRIDWNKSEELKDSYVGRIPCIRSISEYAFSSNVVFFCGKNGSGKSTLLEAIAKAYGLNPEGGYGHFMYSEYDDISPLWKSILIGKVGYPKRKLFLRGESFYNIGMIHDNDWFINTHENYKPWLQGMSHGQAFLKMIQSSGINSPNLYLLDEPEAGLSMEYQMSLLYFIINAAKRSSQFVIATHSPLLMAVPGAEIILFGEDNLRRISLEETEAFETMKLFIENRERIIAKFSSEEEEPELP